LIERIDQRGQITTYTYNALNYLTNRAYSPSGANDSFAYDDGGRMLSGNRNGWLDTFLYDGADRVTNTVQNGRISLTSITFRAGLRPTRSRRVAR